MKNILPAVLIVLVCFAASCAPSATTVSSSPDLKLVSEYEGGKLYKAGEVYVLELQGNYRQMGRQYGMLLKKELNELYNLSANVEYIQKQKFTYERLNDVAKSIAEFYPQRYREILYGMAETSGLGLEKQLILNSLEFPPKMGKGTHKCSGIGVWNDYTKDGSLIFGRNNDDTNFFREFGKYMVIAIFKPMDSSINTAIINYAGVIYAANGLNSKGIFLELNAGNMMPYHYERPSIFVTLISMLQDCPDMATLSAAFQAVRVNLSSIINVADKDIAYSFECPTDNVKRREPDKNGLIVATNHFVDPSWNIAPLQNDEQLSWTVKRRDNLLALADKYKGQIDVEKMKQILDTTIENGGATDSAGTIYQIIAVPRDLTMWIKAVDNYDWQKVDIRRLIANN